jgi:hypothetical protein
MPVIQVLHFSRQRTPDLMRKSLKALATGFAIGLVAVVLAGCTMSGKGVEMPANDGSGSDLMRKSPCACSPVDFNSRGFEWLS